MPHSPIRSTTEVLLALALGVAGLGLTGCSDDATCGPGDAPAAGATLTVEGTTISYGGFTASVNNDCTDFASGVISVSVHGTQAGTSQALTLCLPRPDLLGAEPAALVPSRTPPMASDRVQVVDVSADLGNGCTVAQDPAAVPTGTARFTGYCDGGADPAGYALALTGTVMLRRTCGGTVDTVTGTLGGRVAVVKQ